MRKALARTLIDLIENGEDVFLITADVGFKVFKDFRKRYPDRYLNVGIAEASMIGIAAGMALCGKKVFVYSVATFATMRCYEQIRVDLCYQNLPVIIIGGGAGLVYGTAGATHQAIEDIAIMNALPNMTVIAPGDPVEVEASVRKSVELNGPCYIRIAKNHERIVHSNYQNFEIGKAIEIFEGEKMVLITTGNMLNTAIDVRNELMKENIECGVVGYHTIKPLDIDTLIYLSKRYDQIVTIEEHIKSCGLGSIISDALMRNKLAVKIETYGIEDEFSNIAGDQNYLRDYYNISKEKLIKNIRNLI